MGIFDLLRKQFISVIDWTESEDGVLACRFPMRDREIQNGAELTVRDTQLALFVNEGRLADIFEPGHYQLTTKTLPVLTSLKNWDKLFQSPFKSDVIFFSTREQINQKWGTPNAITLVDKDLGAIRLRAHGSYSYRLKNPKTFYEKLSGTREQYTTRELEGQLRAVILTRLAEFFGSLPTGFLHMAANQMKFSDALKEAMTPPFADYGLELKSFFVQSITLPEELQTHFDRAASQRMVGDLRRYAQFQAADSISVAAAHDGGLAEAGVGLGLGATLGQTVGDSLSPGKQAPSGDPTVARLRELHDLVTAGVITQEEYDAKKTELLKKIT